MTRLSALALLVVAGGCAPAAFSAHARDNDVGDLARALALSAAPAGPSRHAMAFLVGTGKLVGYDLDAGRVAWTQPADVRSRVVVGQGAIAHRQGERELVVRAAATGAVRARVTLEPGETFVGCALDGTRLVYVVKTAEGSAIVALDGDGGRAWRRQTPSALGAPAARGGLVAVPFAHQNLSLLDAATGRELARVRNVDEEIAFARARPEGLFYGGAAGVYRLDDRSVSGTRAGSHFMQAKLPGPEVRPAYDFDGYQPAQAAIGAFDRNRTLWRGREDGAGFRDGLVVLHCFRFFFAIDARAGTLRWAWAHPRTDVVASADVGPSIVFASADGDLGVLDARTGAARVLDKTGLRLVGASFDAEGLVAGGAATPPTEEDLARTLAQIVWDHDARFGAVKRFAVDALGEVPGLPVSAALLKIVRAPAGPGPGDVPTAVQKRAGEELVARKDRAAVPLLLDALGQHYDFLEDRQPRGVDVLARALAALGAHEAVPLLAAHLADPETPAAALGPLVTALGALGGPEANAAVGQFLLRYHADPAFLLDPAPLATAGEALVAAGGPTRKTVDYVAADKRTLAPLARQLRVALDAAAAAKKKATPEVAPERTE